jgi:copper resistance protein C
MDMSLRKCLALAAIAGLAFVGAAGAHTHLDSAGPAPGSVVKASPKALRIQFNEEVALAFSGMDVTNAKGEKVATGAASLNPSNKKQLIVPLTADLSPGKYTVVWHAVGADTHRVEGRYSFEVKP